MKIGIIGAGYVGLAAGIELARAGHAVTIFEQDSGPGGLASGFKINEWEWPLEKHYHHWFASDATVREFAKEIDHEIIFTRPKTSIWYSDSFHQLDSPASLLKFPHISFFDRIRTGSTLAYMKTFADWRNLENITAKDFLIKTMGQKSWDVLWKPLFVGKFGDLSDGIPASWFWARIKARTASLGYPVGGFESFALSLTDKFQEENGSVLFSSGIANVTQLKNKKIQITTANSDTFVFDKVLCTLPTPLFLKITSGFPKTYTDSLKPLQGLGAITMVLSLKKQFLKDGTYWLNVNEIEYPFLAVVEHTNFMDKKYYNNEYIIYIGNYLKNDHPFFSYTDVKLLNTYLPFLKKINPQIDKKLINRYFVFKSGFAQPIVPLGFSKNVPSTHTPFKNLYMANMQQVYPWDRGTNFALKLGKDVAKEMNEN